jgi:hypothetical protein
MMIIHRGQIFLEKEHIEALKGEPEYVKRRYQAVAKTIAPDPFRITRQKAAEMIQRSKRQMKRIVKNFREKGIPGLRFKSKRPKIIPKQTAEEIETKILAVRQATGFGPRPISDIVNESLKREGRKERVYPSLSYNILVRYGEIEREKRLQKEWQRFEWGHPNRLIQADLTIFNGVPLLTMEDDHGRKGWAMVLKNKKDKTVIAGMKKLIQFKFDNLLTDNGSQFSRSNAAIRNYCEEFVKEKHIWTSIHHPQTMGKLSAFQKGLKRFLRHRLKGSRNKREIQHLITVYIHWYNNGKFHSAIGTYPEVRYAGKRNENWYERLVKALKLEGVLTVIAEG